MKKIAKVTMQALKQVQGEKFIEATHETEGCAEGSEEVILHFSNGKQISIYVVRGEVFVEGD